MSRECFECGRSVGAHGVVEVIFEETVMFHPSCLGEFRKRNPLPAPATTPLSRWDRSTKNALAVGRGEKALGRSFAAKGRLA